ncbi:hypothetical protein HYW42_03445 [Candidatus Daviesbacteria bacterium]|nr:hypothetical protein [Candidatus Daviesbacteria bacterium]
MARVFLDTNIFIDLVEQRRSAVEENLENHDLFLSPLSIHILLYVTKKKIPYDRLTNIVARFHLISFDGDTAYRALEGPTADFEDNVQLLSGSTAECDAFLTADEKLLKLKFFGKMEIKPTLVKF